MSEECTICGTDRCACPDRFYDKHGHSNDNTFCCICRDRMDWVFNENEISIELRVSGYCPHCLETSVEVLEKMAEEGEHTNINELKTRGYVK